MEMKMDFSTKMKLAALKPMLPMVKPAAEKLFGTMLSDTQAALCVEQGETQAALLCFENNGEILFASAALDVDNRIVRIVERRTLDQLTTLLTSIF